MIPFGPQLIGQTEKTLNALLRTVLVPHSLTEREWVTLRLASQFDGVGDLDAFISERLPDPDTGRFLAALRRRGLLAGSALSAEGATAVADIGETIATLTRPLWEEVEPQDAEAAARALNIVLDRARTMLRGTDA